MRERIRRRGNCRNQSQFTGLGAGGDLLVFAVFCVFGVVPPRVEIGEASRYTCFETAGIMGKA